MSPAGHACARYEHWASEVARLTAEIGAVECPHEVTGGDENDGFYFEPSCFHAASTEEFKRPEVTMFEDAPIVTRRTLNDIGEAVSDCPACSRLVVLIRERKHARQRYGVAKRRVRHVGKALR